MIFQLIKERKLDEAFDKATQDLTNSESSLAWYAMGCVKVAQLDFIAAVGCFKNCNDHLGAAIGLLGQNRLQEAFDVLFELLIQRGENAQRSQINSPSNPA